MASIAELFLNNVKKQPGKKAIWCDGKEMTYGELCDYTCRYANYLIDNGVEYGDIIGIPMNNSIESVSLMLASAMLGVGLAPINPTLPADGIRVAFETGHVKHVIARKSFWKQFENLDISVEGMKLCLDGEYEDIPSFEKVKEASNEIPDMSKVTGKETWILTMTSGSTGNPKPIELTQENKRRRIDAHVKMYDITEEDKVLAATPLYHSLAERLVMLPLMIGATSILLPRFTPNLWLKCVDEQKVTFTIAVSAQLGQIAQLLTSPFVPDITSLRAIVSSSALLEPHVRSELIEKLKCDFHEMYGTSEISTATSINFREANNKQQSVGRPIEVASLKILNNDGNEVKIGEVGEISCKTDLIFNGYYHQPDMTNAAYTEDGYFKTGDLGKVDDEGYLYFCGRKKELIITGGINVYPNDVDKSLSGLDGVKECAAFPYPDDRLGEVVAVAVVKEDSTNLSERDVKLHCARNMADFQIPHYIFFVDELPKNAMGKLMRNRIIEQVRINEA